MLHFKAGQQYLVQGLRTVQSRGFLLPQFPRGWSDGAVTSLSPKAMQAVALCSLKSLEINTDRLEFYQTPKSCVAVKDAPV